MNTQWETACLRVRGCTVQPSQIGVDVADVISVIKAINEFFEKFWVSNY